MSRRSALQAGEVRIQIEAALTCGTDLKVFKRGYHARMLIPPAAFGHEFAGVISELAPDVTGWRVGERVAVANSAPCGAVLLLPQPPGKPVRRFAVPERRLRQVHRRPGADRAEEPAAAQAGDRFSRRRAGRAAGLRGAGNRRHAVARRAAGAGDWRRPDRPDVCRAGPAPGLPGDGGGPGQEAAGDRPAPRGGTGPECRASRAGLVAAIPPGSIFDVVIEAVGKPETWEAAVRLVRKGGTVNFFGGCPSGTTVSLDTALIHYSNLTLLASFHHTPRTVRRALEFIEAGVVRSDDFVDGECSLERAAHAVPVHGLRQPGREDTGAGPRMNLKHRSANRLSDPRLATGVGRRRFLFGIGPGCGNSIAAEKAGKDHMQLTSTAFTEGAAIPAKHTCDAKNVSPPLKWSGVPAGAKSLALIVDDPDAPSGTWVHWVLYDLPATASELAEDVAEEPIRCRRREAGPQRLPDTSAMAGPVRRTANRIATSSNSMPWTRCST